jgi:hypothetical protein
VNEADVRRTWLLFQKDVGNRRQASKQSHLALFDMYERYRTLSPQDRCVVNCVLIEQVGSPDENVRFDALAVIEEFSIDAALPALRALADRLEDEPSPGAPYEWAKVNRLIGNLSGH